MASLENCSCSLGLVLSNKKTSSRLLTPPIEFGPEDESRLLGKMSISQKSGHPTT